MIPNYFHIRSRVTKLLTNFALITVLALAGSGLSFSPALASPQVQDTPVNRQSMAETQNRGRGTAPTKSELDRKFQEAAQTSVQQVTSGVKSALESAAETIEDVANPETEESARQLGNRARRDMRLLKDTVEDLGPN